MRDETLGYGTVVEVCFKGLGLKSVKGLIVGVSREPLPVVGRGYIVDIGTSLNETYPYRCLSVNEIDLKVLPQGVSV